MENYKHTYIVPIPIFLETIYHNKTMSVSGFCHMTKHTKYKNLKKQPDQQKAGDYYTYSSTLKEPLIGLLGVCIHTSDIRNSLIKPILLGGYLIYGSQSFASVYEKHFKSYWNTYLHTLL